MLHRHRQRRLRRDDADGGEKGRDGKDVQQHEEANGQAEAPPPPS